MKQLSRIRWDLDIRALSSIVHCEDRGHGKTGIAALFRRETIVSPDGEPIKVPVISGNSFRGILRRIGEELTANALGYEQSLPLPAAHLLANGGRLAKAASELTDERERELKELIPHVAVFGGAASARIMSGLLCVDKVLPVSAELLHILRRPPQHAPKLARTVEFYSHLADHRVDLAHPRQSDTGTDNTDGTSPLAKYGIETLPAGTRLQGAVEITYATDLQAAFMTDVMKHWAAYGHLGGRTAAGHGRIAADVTVTAVSGQLPGCDVDWVRHLSRKRRPIIKALQDLA